MKNGVFVLIGLVIALTAFSVQQYLTAEYWRKHFDMVKAQSIAQSNVIGACIEWKSASAGTTTATPNLRFCRQWEPDAVCLWTCPSGYKETGDHCSKIKPEPEKGKR